PESEVYVEQLSYTLAADLDVSSFEKAWRSVLERHPVLRSLIVWHDRGKPLQVVMRSVDLPWEVSDLRALAPAERPGRVEEYHRAERKRGFKLSQPPLLRFRLIRFDQNRFEFVWTYHHLVLDGWSAAIVRREAMALYEAYRRGREAELPLVRPFSVYVDW